MSNRPLERLSRAAEEALGEDPRPATFARGLAIGALVGAAIAGSTIWQRRHGRGTSGSPASATTEPAGDARQAGSPEPAPSAR